MKNFIILNLLSILLLFTTVYSKAVEEDKNELKEISKVTVLLEKYKNVTHWENDGNANVNVDIPGLVLDSEKLSKKISSNKVNNPSATHYKSQLNDFEMIIYNALEKICNVKPVKTLSTTITNLESYRIEVSKFDTSVGRPVGAFMRDNQEYWWIHSYEKSGYSKNGYISQVTVTIISEYTISNINKNNDRVLEAAQNIANQAKKQKTLYKKLLYIHDYLANTITYTEGEGSVYHNLYGALINKKCVCGAYGEAFAYISRLVGGYVIGVNSYNHGWDYARLGKNWYAVDVTWDDLGDGIAPVHNYFLVGSNTVVADDGHRYKDETDTRPLADFIEVGEATGFTFPVLSKEKYKDNNKDPEPIPNERCGSNFNNQKCSSGQCCSKFGFCGVTDGHCGNGCQKKFGGCNEDANSLPLTDGQCGPGLGRCKNSLCCSQFNWCGNTSSHCGTGCLKLYGRCN